MTKRHDLLQAASDGKDLRAFQELIEDDDIDFYKDKDGNTLLSIVAKNGHKDHVKLLLAKGARINIRNSDGKTPLVHAAENGYSEIVGLLLDDKNFQNPASLREAVSEAISSAAAGEHSSLLRHLLKDYNYDLPLHQAQIIFIRAVTAGHKEMVKLLLGRYDIDINGADDSGNTALYIAVQACHKDVVEVLLERGDIDINAESISGEYAFSAALRSGREDLAELLYATGRIDKGTCCTALFRAAENNNTTTVKWLLSKDEVDVNAKPFDDITPLHIASKNGCEETTKLLLARKDIIINATNYRNETPLHMAIEEGHTDIIKLFVARKDSNINAENEYKETPLHTAIRNGHTEIIKLLLTRNDININAKNFAKSTPLSLAVQCGYTEILRLLLGTRKVNFNTHNNESKDLLSMAVNKGRAEIVKLLLENDESKDCIATPLLYKAAKGGYAEIFKLLLTRYKNGINLDIKCSKTLLHVAAENGHTGVVKLLLKTGGINVNVKTHDDETPLFLALQNGHGKVIKLLLARDDLDLKAAEFSDGYLINWAAINQEYSLMDLELARECTTYPGRTPLTRSSEKGYLEALECLLERDGTDVSSMDIDGRTPLSRAAEKKHDGVVEMLLQYNADCNLKDRDGRTPLSWAAENEHKEIVKQLVPHDTATLFHLIEEGNKKAVDFMLRYKSNLEEKNDLGQTALHLAARFGRQNIARALMLRGVDVNPKDDYDMTPLQLAMQIKDGKLIQELLAFKANPEGITGEKWRKAFEKLPEDVIQLSRKPDGEHYINFPTTFPVGEELLRTPTGIKSCLYMLTDDLKSSIWSKISSCVFTQSRLEPNKLITTKTVVDNSLYISISLWLSVNIYSYDQPFSVTGDKVSRIMWRSMRPTNPSSQWNTVVYLSTLPSGWIPQDGVDMFRQFLDHIKSQWLDLCYELDNHLAQRRLDQMEYKGKNPEMIDFLARFAQNLANLRTILTDQASAAETSIRDYCLHYNASHIPKRLLELLKNDIELGITKRIADLDQAVRDLLNIEFAWITIHETRVSTKLGQHVMLLTYVSIFYLPLGFCAALWAIPNITDTSTRTPFILTAIIVSFITLVITFNMESIAGYMQQGYNSYTAFRREKRRPQSPGLP